MSRNVSVGTGLGLDLVSAPKRFGLVWIHSRVGLDLTSGWVGSTATQDIRENEYPVPELLHTISANHLSSCCEITCRRPPNYQHHEEWTC